MSTGLYIHIPFCASRCPYCDFAFVVGKNHLAGRYTSAIIQEFRTRLKQMKYPPTFETIYFGGGTPSSIPSDLLYRILNVVHQESTVSLGAEITIEANPTDQAIFETFRKIGFNRLSIGIQALNDPDLKNLGRFHNRADALSAFYRAQQAQFQNINLDLMFGAPNQTLVGWNSTLDQAITLAPNHFSVYGLTVESGTAFSRRLQKGQLLLPLEDEQAEMYKVTQEKLVNAGYLHYEVSNFAHPGFFSQHNLNTWKRRPYIGLGLSAHSFLNGCRFWNIQNLSAYLEKIEFEGTAIQEWERLNKQDQLLERVMLGLRRGEGILERLLENNGTTPHLDYLISTRLIERAKGRIRLTNRGFLLADLVCEQLVKDF